MDQITKKRVAFMKKILLLIYMMFPVLVMAQGHKGEVDECAPMKNGKVCYSDDVEIENTSKLEIFNAINAWVLSVSFNNNSTLELTKMVPLFLFEFTLDKKTSFP